MPELSIIIPAFNEVERIGNTLESFHQYLTERNFSFEIIVVDDGSDDDTVELLHSLQKFYPELLVLESDRNYGKGHAVRMGMLHAKGEFRLFSDADGSTPITELNEVLMPLQFGEYDIAIGSRKITGSEVTKAQPLYRRMFSKVSHKVVEHYLLPGIADAHCGFKCFTASSAKELFTESRVNEWSFDLEVLKLAQLKAMRITEVPVKWENDERTRGKLSHAFTEIRNLRRIRKSVNRPN